MCLSAKERKALIILQKKPCIPARIFAILYFGDTKSQGLICSQTPTKFQKPYYGREAWRKGAAVLAGLIKKGYVTKITQIKPPKYRLTELGLAELEEEAA